MLQAGTAKVNITPPVGSFLSGYAARDHGAEGIHDELCARVLYLNDGDTELVLVTVELIGLSNDLISAVRSRVEAETGVPGQNIVLSATHTHSAPSAGGSPINDRYMATLEDKLVGAIVWARSKQAEVGAVRFLQEGVQCGVNRRERRGDKVVLGINPDGLVYPFVDILHVTDPHGVPITSWFCHPCHAVVMGQDNYFISGDYAGAACRFVEANSPGIAQFANGCAGNINAEGHNGTFADVERVGRRLGAAVIEAITKTGVKPLDNTKLAISSYSFGLPVGPVPSIEEATAKVEQAEKELAASPADKQKERALADAKQQLVWAKGEEKVEAPVTVQVVTIGETAILCLPGEIFIELAYQIQEGSPFARTIVTGYNGPLGYIPIRSAFEEGGYEVEMARARHRGLKVTPDAPDELVRHGLEALHTHRKSL